jgi:hypothetical protein
MRPQRVFGELRVVTRFGYGPDIYEHFNGVRSQDCDELVGGMGRMADCINGSVHRRSLDFFSAAPLRISV